MEKLLRQYIFEIVRASKGYMKKEEIREKLQELITDRVKSRDIKSQEDLDSFFKDVEMASRALRGIPIEVFAKLAKK